MQNYRSLSSAQVGSSEPTLELQREREPVPELDLTQVYHLLRLAWRQGKSHFPCNTGPERNLRGGSLGFAESFTAMIIAELLMEQPGQAPLVREILSALERELGDSGLFHFFKEHERLPADADSTSVGYSVLLRGGASGGRMRERAHRALDRILNNVSPAGVVETYFDPTGERSGIVDAVVCANVLYFAHLLNRGPEARATLEHVHRVLVEETYLRGSRYYHSPDSFLFFVGRLVHAFPETHDLLLEPLRHAIRKRLGISSYTIDVAQRVLLCAWFGIDDEGEGERLLQMRENDGNWPTDALFRSGRRPLYFGSRAMATTFAMTAVVEWRKARLEADAVEDASEVALEAAETLSVTAEENVTFVQFGHR